MTESKKFTSRKLGRVMSGSRMMAFIACMLAIFAWIMSMPALLTVSVGGLIVTGVVYLKNKLFPNKREAV